MSTDMQIGNNPRLGPKRRRAERPQREIPEIIEGTERMILANGRRVAEQGDYTDLPLLRDLHQTVATAMATAVEGLRARDYSDADIARGLGVTPQAVNKNWPRRGG